ncbi:MAG: SHOCT domain-containing protein [Sulfurovum sp.]|nr:SHOCT domain-containing protein [Sulfurovum sp.]
MYCKECGAENKDNNLRCLSCNSYLNISNSPLTGGDRVKIISFFAFLILPFMWLGGSVLIILIAVFALYIMRKDESFTPITNAKKYMKIYLVVVSLVIVSISSIIYYDEKDYSYYSSGSYERIYNENVKEETAMVAIGGLIATPFLVGFFMFIFNSLFFRPLEKHKNWIVKNGIFSDEKNVKADSTNIVGRDNLSSYSVADEMLKWNDLLEKGLISKEEFKKAKNKLMNGEKV